MKGLQQIANDFFAKNKDVEKVYVTDDGFVFLKKNTADLHATTNADNKKLSVTKFERAKVKPDTSTSPETEGAGKGPGKGPDKKTKLTAEQRIEKIKAMTSVEEIDAFIKGDKAVTVKAAAAERKAELLSEKKSPEVPGTDDTGKDNTDTQNGKQ